MAAKKMTREEKINFIKRNLHVFKPRSKKDETKFNGFEEQNDEKLDILYKVIQGSVRRLNAKNNANGESSEKAENQKKRKNDIFKKYGLDKTADLNTLKQYQRDAQALMDAVTARISTFKETTRTNVQKEIEKLQKKLAELE